jgi:hypothetical protein
MKNYLILFYSSILISILLTNYANSANGLNLENKQENTVKFSEVESAPFYIDWCTSNLAEDKIRECTDSGIKLFAKQYFNTELANELKLSGYQRITSAFIIDKNGDVIDIRVRAPHPQLKDEAIRIINLLPKMEPGKVNGKAVSVSYLLPIIFKVQSDSLSQSEKNPILNVVDGDNVEVSFSTVQNVPIFPGCEKGNNAQRRARELSCGSQASCLSSVESTLKMSAGFFLILQHPSLTDTKSNHQHKRTSNGRMQGDRLIGQPSGAGIALIFGYPKTGD